MSNAHSSIAFDPPSSVGSNPHDGWIQRGGPGDGGRLFLGVGASVGGGCRTGAGAPDRRGGLSATGGPD